MLKDHTMPPDTLKWTQLIQPPVCTFPRKLQEDQIGVIQTNLKEMTTAVIATQEQNNFSQEAFILSRIIYKANYTLTREKLWQSLKQTQKCVKRLQRLDVNKDIRRLLENWPTELDEDEPVSLPSRCMVEHVLAKMVAAVQLHHQLTHHCIGAYSHALAQMKLGMHVPTMTMVCGCVSRLWVLSHSMKGHISKLYANLFQIKPILEGPPYKKVDWELPTDLVNLKTCKTCKPTRLKKSADAPSIMKYMLPDATTESLDTPAFHTITEVEEGQTLPSTSGQNAEPSVSEGSDFPIEHVMVNGQEKDSFSAENVMATEEDIGEEVTREQAASLLGMESAVMLNTSDTVVYSSSNDDEISLDNDLEIQTWKRKIEKCGSFKKLKATCRMMGKEKDALNCLKFVRKQEECYKSLKANFLETAKQMAVETLSLILTSSNTDVKKVNSKKQKPSQKKPAKKTNVQLHQMASPNKTIGKTSPKKLHQKANPNKTTGKTSPKKLHQKASPNKTTGKTSRKKHVEVRKKEMC